MPKEPFRGISIFSKKVVRFFEKSGLLVMTVRILHFVVSSEILGTGGLGLVKTKKNFKAKHNLQV